MTNRTRKEEVGPQVYRSRVVLKFHDSVELRYVDGVESQIQRLQIGPWDRLVGEFPGITFKRFYTALEPEEIRALVNRGTKLDPTYVAPNFFACFVVDCPPDVNPESMVQALSLWQSIETAYVERRPASLPQAINPQDDPGFKYQGYLKKAPDGIDAEYAWQFPGGGGDGVRIVDLEHGWLLNHEDLADANVTLIGGVNSTDLEFVQHGTAALGIVVAMDNTKGGIGIAPHALARVMSDHDGVTYNVANAIMMAINALNYGDVLLLELAAESSPDFQVPLEWNEIEFQAIRLGTANGIVIVEPAGNSMCDLDALPKLNRNRPEFEDSGAILVGMASSTSPHMRDATVSNFGNRVDCYAWGESIYTCSADPSGTGSAYTHTFSGTSGASAIIAGAALVVQGIAEARFGRRYGPWQLRAILSDENLGTPAALKVPAFVGGPNVGVMPDLRKIVSNMPPVALVPVDIGGFKSAVSFLFGSLSDGGYIGILPNGRIIHIPPYGPPDPLTGQISEGLSEMVRGLILRDVAMDSSDAATREALERTGVEVVKQALEIVQREIGESGS
jgi:serine protease